MNLRGIQHLLKCQNSELVKAKPPFSQVEQDYETFETKEYNFEKVDRAEDKETEAERTPEESKSVFPRLRTCTGVGDDDDDD